MAQIMAAVAIAQISSLYAVNYTLIFAAAFSVSAIPMVVIMFFQRYFSASVASTGGK